MDNIKLSTQNVSADLKEDTQDTGLFSFETSLVVSDPMMCCPLVLKQMYGDYPVSGRCMESYKGVWGETMTLSEWFATFRKKKVGGEESAYVRGISSCEELIENPVLRAFVWVMAIVAFAGNAAVIIYRLVWEDKSRRGQSFWLFVINLSLSDLLMGVYLVIIALTSFQLSGQYALHDGEWRLGRTCRIAGTLATVSSETSAIFVLLITLDRFVAVRFPFRKRMSRHATLAMVGCSWLLGLALALVPLVMPDWQVYSFNSICVGLPLNSQHYPGSTYATGVFIGVNSAIFLLIALGQGAIVWVKWASSAQIKLSMSSTQAQLRYKEDLKVARYLSLIVLSDFCCWFPICVMALMAQTGHDVAALDTDVYAWSAVVVLPVNSALNPLLYTSPAVTHLYRYIKGRCVCR